MEGHRYRRSRILRCIITNWKFYYSISYYPVVNDLLGPNALH
jgi:hypothetical protein